MFESFNSSNCSFYIIVIRTHTTNDLAANAFTFFTLRDKNILRRIYIGGNTTAGIARKPQTALGLAGATEMTNPPGLMISAPASGTGAVLDLVISPEALTPRVTLSQMRDSALAAQRS